MKQLSQRKLIKIMAKLVLAGMFQIFITFNIFYSD